MAGFPCHGPLPSFLQGTPQLSQSFFLNAGDVAATDPQNPRHLPLPFRGTSGKTIAQQNHLTLLLCQTGINGTAQEYCHLSGGHLLHEVYVLADHIHQRQGRAVGAGFDAVKQGHILSVLLLGTEVHQNLICYPPPNAFLMH